MLTARFLLGRDHVPFSASERQALESAVATTRALAPRAQIVRRGEVTTHSLLLLDGYMCRYMDDRAGHRQLVAVHVPGDFVDLHSFPTKRLDHDVATLGPATVAVFEHRSLAGLVERFPRLTQLLWFSTLLDAAMHREWIFRLGRLGADGRIAHFFAELECRLTMVGLSADGRFTIPITQLDIAEACGITGVHVNRVLRQLREAGIVLFRGGEVQILDRPRLRELAEFDPSYLYPARSSADDSRGIPGTV